jgi:hypothetical protein
MKEVNMTKRFAMGSAIACLLIGAAPAFADGGSDTYHEFDLHCAVGGAAACARPSGAASGQTGSVSLPSTPSATADSIPAGTNGTSTLR